MVVLLRYGAQLVRDPDWVPLPPRDEWAQYSYRLVGPGALPLEAIGAPRGWSLHSLRVRSSLGASRTPRRGLVPVVGTALPFLDRSLQQPPSGHEPEEVMPPPAGVYPRLSTQSLKPAAACGPRDLNDPVTLAPRPSNRAANVFNILPTAVL